MCFINFETPTKVPVVNELDFESILVKKMHHLLINTLDYVKKRFFFVLYEF